MKAPFLLLIFVATTLFTYAQTPVGKNWPQFIQQIHDSAVRICPHQHQTNNTSNRPVSAKLPVLGNVPSPTPSYRQTLSANINSYLKAPTARATTTCVDSSYSHLLSVKNSSLYLDAVTKCANGGLLVTAEMYDTSRPANIRWIKSYGLLLKTDDDGNVLWLKQFEELGTTNSLFYLRASELNNHDIALTGLITTSQSSGYTTLIYRLTNTGAIIWQSFVKSNIAVFNSAMGQASFYSVSAKDGLNGDVIVSGTNASNLSNCKFETVARFNNNGQLMWDANYGNLGDYNSGAEGITAFIENGQIMLVGYSHGSSLGYPGAITFLTLDYNTGNLISKRMFKFTSLFQKTFTWWNNKCTRLANGHLLVYGQLFSDFYPTTVVVDHFGVVEFDASYNLVNAYTISSTQTTNYYNSLLQFDASGKGMLSILSYIGSYESNVFWGTFENGQFQNQRKKHYVGVGIPEYNGYAWLNDNSYAYLQNYFSVNAGTQSYFEFRKMHNSDTSSLCLGKDTSLFTFLPLTLAEDPSYYLLDGDSANKLQTVTPTISQTDTTLTGVDNTCHQINYCDTVKIHGDSVICGNATSLVFTAFKNTACGATVQWNIDNNAIDSIHIINDTTAQCWFKQSNWSGKLYARLTAGACFMPTTDSMQVVITRSQQTINLGADTVLCPQSNLVLHAGRGFSSYQWQDGSTDSIFIVTTAGTYTIMAKDGCGNSFTDAITITPYNVFIDIGPDRIKCNTDTLHLDAPAGFINYLWSNNYNINYTTGQHVIVNPLTDTAYYIKAEKQNGCFAYDTIHIQVKTSPPIQLGPDRSFCLGDSAVLNAGSGFIDYAWSTGDTRQQITVFTKGIYTVTGTMANQCKSYDTLKVVNVWPLPKVSLNHNNELCNGETRILNAGNFATYQWQDGSTHALYPATGKGTYYVTVTDNNHCQASDTVHITTIRPLPANFLPADTAICSYWKIQLKPLQSYSDYLWSNNASTSSITISQPGIYWLQVTDGHSCTGVDTILVQPKTCLIGFKIPNAFSPNHDGYNDTFKPIIGAIVMEYQFTVYNRWGQVVFSTNNLYQGWDGTMGGTPQNSNVFVWSCKYKTDTGIENVEKGTVLLIR